MLGGSIFRVWIERPDATAEYFKDGDWVGTHMPSGSITGNPQSVEITGEEFERLRHDD